MHRTGSSFKSRAVGEGLGTSKPSVELISAHEHHEEPCASIHPEPLRAAPTWRWHEPPRLGCLRHHEEPQQVTLELVKRILLSELFMDTGRLKQFKEELRPRYSDMPKAEHGTLEPTVVRYASHRFFVQKQGGA